MGSALADILLSNGCQVITSVDGRSESTRQRCESTGMSVRGCVAGVVSEADVLLSTVTPHSVLDIAQIVARAVEHRSRPLIYIDANSVSADVCAQLEDLFSGRPVRFVDAAIHGQASRLRTQGTIFASGTEASVVSELFAADVRVRLLGLQPGNASLMKMSLGGMSKGMIGLFLQSGMIAERSGMLTEFCEELGHYYPDVLSFVERSLPTYPRHAGRRAQEMQELKTTLEQFDLPVGTAIELGKVFSQLDSSQWSSLCALEPGPLPVNRLVELIACSKNSMTEPSSEFVFV